MNICWFGIYKPDFGRNRIYMKALRKAGYSIVECRDDSRGFLKYLRLWQKHRDIQIRGGYEAMIVGYPGHIVVPFAKLISKKKVVVDALGSLYDAEVNSHRPNLFKKIKSRCADRLMVMFADKIMLESEAQKKFFEDRFGKSDKYEVVYTGADEDFFRRVMLGVGVNNPQKDFIVLFRGKLTPECGILHILKAAEILKGNSDIKFKIIGSGYFLEKTERFIREHDLLNVELITRFLSDSELTHEVNSASLMLGQFEDNPRLNRTIPHKAFEAMASGVPYLTGDSPTVQEISSVLVTPLADPDSMAKIIESLSHKLEVLLTTSERALKQFDDKFSSRRIAEKIISIVS